MKTFIFLLFLSLTQFAYSQQSNMGGHDGGGGQGVVCYNDQNQIETVELLDLYEGRNLEKLNYSEQSGSYEEIFKAITYSSDKRIKKILSEGYKRIKPGLRFMAEGVRLKPIHDANTIFIPRNCKIEQLVNFQGVSRIFIVTDFWEKLSETNKAALIVHELLWKIERHAGTIYSSRARRQVARLFADNFSIKPQKFTPQLGDIECWALNEKNRITAEFYVPSSSCKIHFKEINSGDIYGTHEAEFFSDECNDWKNYLLNKDPEGSGGISIGTINTILQVMDEGTNVISHEINLKRKPTIENGQKRNLLFISTDNWEFSGFDTENHQLECFEYSGEPEEI